MSKWIFQLIESEQLKLCRINWHRNAAFGFNAPLPFNNLFAKLCVSKCVCGLQSPHWPGSKMLNTFVLFFLAGHLAALLLSFLTSNLCFLWITFLNLVLGLPWLQYYTVLTLAQHPHRCCTSLKSEVNDGPYDLKTTGGVYSPCSCRARSRVTAQTNRSQVYLLSGEKLEELTDKSMAGDLLSNQKAKFLFCNMLDLKSVVIGDLKTLQWEKHYRYIVKSVISLRSWRFLWPAAFYQIAPSFSIL